MKKRFVIVSNFYPPFAHVASNRILAFAKYLDKSKYDITVVTEAREGEVPLLDGVEVIPVKKTSGFNKLDFTKESSKFVHKSKAAYNKLFLALKSDEYAGWTNSVKKVLEIENKKQKIDYLMVSFAPVSPVLAGIDFIKKHPSTHLITDMRDEMSLSPFISGKRKSFLQSVEKEVFKYSKLILSVSEPIVESFKKLSNGEVDCIELRNGYDFECVNDYTPNRKFKVLYLGTFYANRKPDLFFKAINELIKSGELNPINLDVEFIGPTQSYSVPDFMTSLLKQRERIPHNETLNEMKAADCLLVMHPNNGVKGIFTGKIFEYLGACRPVLALVDEDDVAAELIRECEAGQVADFHDLEKIKKAFMSMYKSWEEKIVFAPKLDLIREQRRDKQVSKLNEYLANQE